MEFEAETWWFQSTHEYYKTTKFQLQTPSPSTRTGNQLNLDYTSGARVSPLGALVWKKFKSLKWSADRVLDQDVTTTSVESDSPQNVTFWEFLRCLRALVS